MKKLVLAALLAASVFPGASASYANHCPEPPNVDPECELGHASSGCGFDSVQQETATGQNYEGAAYGYAVNRTGGPISIRCYITVNGVPAAAGSTPTGTGIGSATTAGPISFEAATGADVEMCTEVNGTTIECGDSTNTQIPPQEVIDLIIFLTSIPDPLICPILEDLGDLFEANNLEIPGVLEFGDQDGDDPNDPGDGGDVYIGGDLFWDCPPYEPVTP